MQSVAVIASLVVRAVASVGGATILAAIKGPRQESTVAAAGSSATVSNVIVAVFAFALGELFYRQWPFYQTLLLLMPSGLSK